MPLLAPTSVSSQATRARARDIAFRLDMPPKSFVCTCLCLLSLRRLQYKRSNPGRTRPYWPRTDSLQMAICSSRKSDNVLRFVRNIICHSIQLNLPRSGTAMHMQKICLYALSRASSRQCCMRVGSSPTTCTTFLVALKRMVCTFLSLAGFALIFVGSGAVYSFDPVGSYEREACRAAGAASSLVQPFLDNQVSSLVLSPRLSHCSFCDDPRDSPRSSTTSAVVRRVSKFPITACRFIHGPRSRDMFFLFFLSCKASNLVQCRSLCLCCVVDDLTNLLSSSPLYSGERDVAGKSSQL